MFYPQVNYFPINGYNTLIPFMVAMPLGYTPVVMTQPTLPVMQMNNYGYSSAMQPKYAYDYADKSFEWDTSPMNVKEKKHAAEQSDEMKVDTSPIFDTSAPLSDDELSDALDLDDPLFSKTVDYDSRFFTSRLSCHMKCPGDEKHTSIKESKLTVQDQPCMDIMPMSKKLVCTQAINVDNSQSQLCQKDLHNYRCVLSVLLTVLQRNNSKSLCYYLNRLCPDELQALQNEMEYVEESNGSFYSDFKDYRFENGQFTLPDEYFDNDLGSS